ncbi:MAG: hypothetical protein KBC21_03655 [Candidatus Pacebacteria bacterium]|nr:hypothetical protein [Candidatus Paceibacterota bacterium]
MYQHSYEDEDESSKRRELRNNRLVGGDECERLLLDIPIACRGARFERIFPRTTMQDNTRQLEAGFVNLWAEKYKESLLPGILGNNGEDPQFARLPKTEREWEVAELVAATLIQWLPTTAGCSFLQHAFDRGGGSMKYKLPDEEAWMPELRPFSHKKED